MIIFVKIPAVPYRIIFLNVGFRYFGTVHLPDTFKPFVVNGNLKILGIGMLILDTKSNYTVSVGQAVKISRSVQCSDRRLIGFIIHDIVPEILILVSERRS